MLSSEPKEGTIADKYRSLEGAWRWGYIGLSILVVALTITFVFQLRVKNVTLPEYSFLAAILAIALFQAFIILPATKNAPRDRIPWYDLIAAVMGFLAPISIFPNALTITFLGLAANPPLFYILTGVITWGLLMEVSRRALGSVFTAVVLLFGTYPLYCQFMPGFMVGLATPFGKLVGYHFLGFYSVFGLPLSVCGSTIIGFMVFAVALQATGGGTFFLNLALSLLGHVRGGPAKVSVVASGLFGSISGSVIANVLTTGAVTIPTMKRSGYPAYYAGAVEAAASTGGVLAPPIMGITAFIMAEFLEVAYINVAAAAAIPTVLYYLGLFLQVDGFAAKKGISGLPRKELPSLRRTIKEGWFFILAILLLIYFLAYLRLTNYGSWYATVALFLLAMLRRETWPTPKVLKQFIESTGKVVMEIIIICAAVGMIIGGLEVSGLGLSFSDIVVSIGRDNIFLLLLLGAVTSGILGMGMTISACYIFLALVLAPGLVKSGLDPMAVHLYILYWGMVSFITPPVALGAYAAASLAGAPPMKTGFQAMRLGAIIYFVPFFFVLEPALILHGPALIILRTIAFAIIGIVLISAGLEGYLFQVGSLKNPLVRTFFIILGTLMAYPDLLTSIIGLGAAVLIILILLQTKRLSAKSPSGATTWP